LCQSFIARKGAFRRAGGDTQHLALAVLVDGDGQYYGIADDPATIARLQVSGVSSHR
jgi:hypothetical protein